MALSVAGLSMCTVEPRTFDHTFAPGRLTAADRLNRAGTPW